MTNTNAPSGGIGVTRLAHICLRVNNLDRTVAFYRDALGLPEKFRFQKDGRDIGCYFDVGGGNFIEVFECEGDVTTNTGLAHFCLEVANLERAVAALARAGVVCTGQKLGADQSLQVWIKDPDGHPIELHQYTAASAQRVGGTVTVNW